VNLAVRDYVVLVIPDWWSLTLSLAVLWLAGTNLIHRWWAMRRMACHAEAVAALSEAYARTDEALAPVQETLGQPAEAEAARARAAEYRASARRLRERQRSRKGRFFASGRAAEPSAGSSHSEATGEPLRAAQGVSRPVSGSEG
jgi:hypothetical protein